MEIRGTVRGGVVVLEDGVVLQEGTLVTVKWVEARIHVSENPRPVTLPLFDSAAPGTIDLTDERIAEIFEEEDLEYIRRMGMDHG